MRKIFFYLGVLLVSLMLFSCSALNLGKPQIPISNGCEEDLTVEFVSLIGDKVSQKVNMTIKFTNHDINKTKEISDFKAYTLDGDIFSSSYVGERYHALTDVPVKATWEVGQMVPKKNPKLAAITFTIDDCVIEMRDVPIKWRNSEQQ